MIINPGKFQSISIDNKSSNCNPQDLNIGNKDKDCQKRIKILRIDIDSHLNFDAHASTLCRKASNQLNALCCLNWNCCWLKLDLIICRCFILFQSGRPNFIFNYQWFIVCFILSVSTFHWVFVFYLAWFCKCWYA